ncbi:putative voltage-gated potassium channel subunit beta [Cercophora samala]|uniref:Voltage-gated potassium channel subunit beta n=1 Tax=Cercophora samala TaxID=330535 RepID=A0AA39ZK40_9PEZI|nr:putative voltage-gated potassium channel subunit beta [Cercophora samala]
MSPPTDLPEMEYRFLGRSGLQVSAISLGGWLTYGGHVDREGTYACMKAAYDVGVNFFDCAEVYARGESERVMGEAIKKFGWQRNDLVISTKIYWGSAFSTRPLDYVDLIYAHRLDRNTSMEETVRAFNHLIDTGKALYWGTSEWDADEIAEARHYADKLNLIGPLMEQPRYNMLERLRVESTLAHLLRSPQSLGLTIFSPLRQGILSGKYKSGIPPDSRFAQTQLEFISGFWKRTGQDEFQAMVDTVSKLEPIAERLGVKQSVLALAWVLANKHVSSAITGASSPEQVYENVEAVRMYKLLTEEVLGEIDEILGNKPPAVVMRF